MARFRLKNSASDKDVGRLVLELAEAAAANGGQPDPSIAARIESEIIDLVDDADKPRIAFVYDGPGKVHVAVPYLEGKDYSGNGFADESMGFIVIKGCGR